MEGFMLPGFGLMSLVAAVMLSQWGGRWPQQTVILERAVGACLVAGLTLLGAALPFVA